MDVSRRLAAFVLAAALALPAAASAQEGDVIAFQQATPSCDANPTLP